MHATAAGASAKTKLMWEIAHLEKRKEGEGTSTMQGKDEDLASSLLHSSLSLSFQLH